MSLTLKAPTPYPPLAASSRSCRIDTRGIKILLLCWLRPPQRESPQSTHRRTGSKVDWKPSKPAPVAGAAIILMVAEVDKRVLWQGTQKSSGQRSEVSDQGTN